MAKFDVQCPFVVRQAVQVATSVARAVDADLRFGRVLLETATFRTDRIPTVLRISADPAKNGTCSVRVRFEGGTDITVNLFNTGTLIEEWVVYRATARYYHLDPSYRRTEESKAEKQFSADELARLRKSALGWYQPHVALVTSLVGIFWDNAAATGHIEVDPQTNNSGHSILRDLVFYSVLIPGDRERAVAEARKILATYGA